MVFLLGEVSSSYSLFIRLSEVVLGVTVMEVVTLLLESIQVSILALISAMGAR